MKKLQQTIVAASLVLIALSSCKKEATNQSGSGPGTGPINMVHKVSKIEHENDYSEISYNMDGSVTSIASKLTNGTSTGTLAFNYDGTKIKEATYKAIKLKYTYTGGFVTGVETINGVGVITHRNEFVYTNALLTEMIEHWPSGTTGLKPFYKTVYTYNNAGNITKAESFDIINNAWVKTGEMAIQEYDNKYNTSSNFEYFIYLPNVNFCTNNPLKEEYKDPLGVIVQTVTHAYLYDGSNRPTQRITTTKVPGLADMVETIKFYY